MKPEAKAWLDRYAKLDFFFVALRYDGGGKGTSKVLSKTLRISFDTPNPYYPYFEPTGVPKDDSRKLVVRVASDMPFVPLARREEGGSAAERARARERGQARPASRAQLVRPWSEAATCTKQRAALEEHLSKRVFEDVSERPLQVFVDVKPSREGFGDVLLVPVQPQGCDEECVERRKPLLALLEPSLQGSDTEPASLVLPDPKLPPLYVPKGKKKKAEDAPAPYLAPRSASCSFGANAGTGTTAGLLVLGLLGLRRRRRHPTRRLWASLGLPMLLLSCDQTPVKPEAKPSATASASVMPSPSASAKVPAPPVEDAYALPADKGAQEKDLMKLLSGHHVGWFPARSTAGRVGLGVAHGTMGRLILANIHPEKCLDDPRVEGVAYYRVDAPENDGGAPKTWVWGHLPASVNRCLNAQLAKTKTPSVFGSTFSDRISVGTRTPEQQKYRSKLRGRYVSKFGRGSNSRIRFGAFTVSRKNTLPPEVLRRIVRQNYGRFRLCYDKGKKTNPELEGSLAVKVTVDEKGTVKKVASTKPSKPELKSGLAKQCLRTSLYSLSFPKPEDGKRFDFTFELHFAPRTR